MATDPDSFVSRWSRRKVQAREQGLPPADPPAPPAPVAPPPALLPAEAQAEPASPGEAQAEPASPGEAAVASPPPPPTLADVAELTRGSDFSRFVKRDVTPDVRNAALKKLFTDPQFNVMDGLDTYIDDYGKPDPLPPGMLRKMVQSQLLGLFDDEPQVAAATASSSSGSPPAAAPPAATPPDTALPPDNKPPHEDTDLQLQPDDAAGCPRPGAGAEPDAAGQH